ncbi:hypothetical protein [Amycolatopsis sp. YIM 10]|uniref:hypothetical protein n=1 Tax=Amycolatopsis sp. YIM 10 TaxID=2653857 RepID=UPI00128FFAA4|nr:hypothetical protein [Amycolatopsis sp. YIM 10]QFU91823.1 hypothetical protein YIM_33310 [Amycolatopsis sp. YIM 10]
MLLALVLVSLIGTAPLLVAVAVAVLSGDAGRRADARRVVSLLRQDRLLPTPRRRGRRSSASSRNRRG